VMMHGNIRTQLR